VGVGLAGSFALSRFMTGLLFGVTPADAPTYIGVVVVLVLAAAFSCYLPARQALRTDIVSALTKDQ
jgi:putative ABC transport system permease protein